jgi:Transglycosylase SLT domain
MSVRALRRGPRWFVVLLVVTIGLAGCDTPGSSGDDTNGRGNSSTETDDRSSETDRFAPYVVSVSKHARKAGIHSQLLMAILYNESYKPHDPESERAWAEFDDNPSFGVANMHRAAFNEAKRGRPFAHRKWDELPDDPDLAIQAAAWYLHDLARYLPSRRTRSLTRDELLALGYNAGPGNMRAFARGVTLGSDAQAYLDDLRENWADAGRSLRGSRR